MLTIIPSRPLAARFAAAWLAAVLFVMLTALPARAITLNFSASPARVNTPVAFIVDVGTGTGCTVRIDYGEGAGLQVVAVGISGVVVVEHTYTRPGRYAITANLQVCNNFTPPQQVTATLRVSDFSVDRIQLRFSNNLPQITVKKRAKIAGLSARINFTGSGLLKGYWEVDGKKKVNVFKHLHVGPWVDIEYPKLPPLPTVTPGSHRVRFVPTSPVLSATLPTAVYFVRTDPAADRLTIPLLRPEAGQSLDFVPARFSWKSLTQAALYHIRFYEKDKAQPLFAAYSKKSEYSLKARPLQSRFSPGKAYEWKVFALDKNQQIIGSSRVRPFSFNLEQAWVPNTVIVALARGADGSRLKTLITDRFNARIVDTWPIRSLGLDMVTFYTETDIFDLMAAIRQEKGVVLSQPDYIYSALAGAGADPMDDMQNLPGLSRADLGPGLTGRGVSVGIVDTAIDRGHRDLESAVGFFQNCLDRAAASPEMHGTGVAGLVGARANHYGISGIAPATRILALRACRQLAPGEPQADCYSHAIVRALDAGLEQGAGIINLSLGMQGEDPLVSRLILAGRDKKVLFVAPAGNRPSMAAMAFPAVHPDVISVAGILPGGGFVPDDRLAGQADIRVPCQNLLTTVPGDEHTFLSGTSMASAVVSGLLALCREKDPGFDLDQFRALGPDPEKIRAFLIRP